MPDESLRERIDREVQIAAIEISAFLEKYGSPAWFVTAATAGLALAALSPVPLPPDLQLIGSTLGIESLGALLDTWRNRGPKQLQQEDVLQEIRQALQDVDETWVESNRAALASAVQQSGLLQALQDLEQNDYRQLQHTNAILNYVGDLSEDVAALRSLLLRTHELVRTSLAGPVPQARRPLVSLLPPPAAPRHYLPRPAELQEIKKALPAAAPAPSRPVVLSGPAGSGKSVLAAALARDPTVPEAFPDGILWLDMGPPAAEPPEEQAERALVLARQRTLARMLGVPAPLYADPTEGRDALRILLAGRRCLLILDDVWDSAHAAALLAVDAAAGGRVLLTTRDARVATGLGSEPLAVGPLPADQARQLLAGAAGLAPPALPPEAPAIIERCASLPLALVLCGALIADGLSWTALAAALAAADLSVLNTPLPDYAHRGLVAALAVSLQRLSPAARARYTWLAAVPAGAQIPGAALAALWARPTADLPAWPAYQSGRAARRLVQLALLHEVKGGPEPVYALPALQHTFLRHTAADPARAHGQWLAAYAARCPPAADRPQWPEGPDDGYFFQHLRHHLRGAGAAAEADRLLLSHAWLQACTTHGHLAALLTETDAYPAGSAQAQVGHVLRLAAEGLLADPDQLPGQMLARLDGAAPPALAPLLAELAAARQKPWLRLHGARLARAGDPLVYRRRAHRRRINAVAVAGDRYLATAGDDGTLKLLWLRDGTPARLLQEQGPPIQTLRATPDGRLLVAGAADGSLTTWDLQTGAARPAAVAHRAAVTQLLALDDNRILSAGFDDVVHLWNARTGQPLHAFSGHGKQVAALLVGEDRTLLSAGRERLLLWDLDSGQLRRALTAETGGVVALAALAHGQVAALTARGQLQIWEPATGTCRARRAAHGSGRLFALALPEGRLLTGDGAGTLKLWTAPFDGAPQTIFRADDGLQALEQLPNGGVLAAGKRGVLYIWDSAVSGAPRVVGAPGARLTALAVVAERRAVSADEAGDAALWDWAAQPLSAPPAAAHQAAVTALAVGPGGHIFSTAWDGSWTLWRAADGARLESGLVGEGAVVSAAALDGDRFICGTERGGLYLRRAGRRDAPLLLRAHARTIVRVAAAGAGTMVTGATDRTLRLWRLPQDTLQPLGTVAEAHDWTVSFGLGGRRFVVYADLDGHLKVYDLVEQTTLTLAGGAAPGDLAPAAGSETAAAVRRGQRLTAIAATATHAVAGRGGGRVLVWTLPEGRLLASWASGSVPVTALALNERHLFAGSAGGALRGWDLATRTALAVPAGHTGSVTGLAFTRTGQLVSISSDRQVRVTAPLQGATLATFTLDAGLRCLALSRDPDRIVVGARNGQVHVLELVAPAAA